MKEPPFDPRFFGLAKADRLEIARVGLRKWVEGLRCKCKQENGKPRATKKNA